MAHRAPASPKSMARFPMANETKVVNLLLTPENFALTGISGLDSILEGGIPRSNVTLVEGAIGTGKTTMGVEFVYRGARKVPTSVRKLALLSSRAMSRDR